MTRVSDRCLFSAEASPKYWEVCGGSGGESQFPGEVSLGVGADHAGLLRGDAASPSVLLESGSWR